MKRIISLLILASLLATSLIFADTSGAITHGYIAGDADGEGNINMKDVLLIRRFIACIENDYGISVPAADVNHDDAIDMKDVLQIKRIIAGLANAEGNNTDNAYKVGEIRVAGKNISRYTIVCPESVPDGSEAYLPSMQFAAEELRDNIEDACGVKLNIVYDNDFDEGLAIRYQYDYEDREELGKEGFIIEVTDDDLVFTCGTMRGALYGTYDFLEDEIGYRYMTGYVNYLYESELIDVPVGFYNKEVPAFEYRSIGANGPSQNYAKLKLDGIDGDAKSTPYNGGGVQPVYPHAHSFMFQMAGWERWKDPDLQRTEGSGQPCMTDEETYNKIIDFNYHLIDYYVNDYGLTLGYDFTHVPVSANDNAGFCTCAKCKKVYEEEGSIAGALVRLSNRVAEKICGDYPELQIYTLVYFGTQPVPKSTKPDPRITICFCNVGCNNHLLRHPEECEAAGGNTELPELTEYGGEPVPSNNGMYMDMLKGWLELTDNIWFWYYMPVYFHFASPSPNLFNFWDDLKYLSELGVKGLYLEGFNWFWMDYNFEFMRVYLACKTLWDPGMSEEEYQAHMDEYLRIVFGDGWENVRQYLYMSNHAADINGCGTNNFDYFWEYYNKDYFAEHYYEMRDLMVSARDEAKEGSQRAKCNTAMVSLDFLGLSATYERDWVNGDGASRAKYKQIYEELWSKYHDDPNLIENPYYGTPGSGAVNGMLNFPANTDTCVDPVTWIASTFTGYH
ncbi:MAG: DUF4838 domain-containing protein [Clostridia bacterium]|nr:DUF4838 domain-containing protein [Clostridia bacterium]